MRSLRLAGPIGLLPLGTLLVLPACGLIKQDCPSSLYAYHDKCLSAMAIQYVGCTDGHGINTTQEIGGGVGGSLRVAYAASVQASYKTSKSEDPKVAQQVISDCMKIAKENSPADDPEQDVAAGYIKQRISETPTLRLSRHTASVGSRVKVTGARFWPGEAVDIRLHTTTVAQITADDAGSFNETVTVPEGAVLSGFHTSIVASGNSSSRSADSPFQVNG